MQLTANEETVLTRKVVGNMTDLLYTMAAYTVAQVVLFGLALLAYVRWKVPARDLIVLLRECRLLPPRRDCSRLFVQVQRKRVDDESMRGMTGWRLWPQRPCEEPGVSAAVALRSRS